MNQKYILLISACIAILLSAIISIVPIGYYNQAEVSALLPTLFTPASFTFSIWSIIYLSWLLIWAWEALWKTWITKENAYLLAAAQILSTLWLIPSQSLWIGSSLIVMFGVLYLLGISLWLSRSENTYFRHTVELFFGWILVACIANIHLFLVSYEIYYIPEILTYLSIALALGINIILLQKYNIFIPALVCIWAGFGVFIWQSMFLIQVLGLTSSIVLISFMLFKYSKQIVECFQNIKSQFPARKK